MLHTIFYAPLFVQVAFLQIPVKPIFAVDTSKNPHLLTLPQIMIGDM